MAQKSNPERRKLQVNSIGKKEPKPRKDGQGTFDTIGFNADDITDPDNIKKAYAYSVGNPGLISTIEGTEVGSILDCDIVKITGERQDGSGYTIHQVVQIFKDGQPIAGGRKGGYAGKSIEVVKIERASYEAQVAVKAIVDLAIAGNIRIEDNLLYDKAIAWCEAKIDANMKPAVQEALQKAPGLVAKPEESDGSAPDNVGDLFAKALKQGTTRQMILDKYVISEKDVSSIDPVQMWEQMVADGLVK